jgi:hypothetical protein
MRTVALGSQNSDFVLTYLVSMLRQFNFSRRLSNNAPRYRSRATGQPSATVKTLTSASFAGFLGGNNIRVELPRLRFELATIPDTF